MQNVCGQCGNSFEVTADDLAFYDKVTPVFHGKKYPIPPPKLCSECRQQRRMVQCNEINLYKRKCDLTAKSIIADIHPSTPYTVYEQEVWYSDKWDPLTYGRDVDFNRPFFEQYLELSRAVPHMNLFTGYQYDENCDYTNYSGKNKNCYLIFDSDENRDCEYCYSINGCRDCFDCYRVRSSELCYWAVDCEKCYGGSFLQECVNCIDCMFMKNSTGCKNCLMSSNLVNKEYVVENTQVTKEKFEAYMRSMRSRRNIDASHDRFEQLKLQYPQKFLHGWQNENVSGDYITQSKNARECFDGTKLWDCARVYRAFMPVKDSMDCDQVGEVERCYECSVSGYNGNHLLFSCNCLDQISDLTYCMFCLHSSHLFGCNGIRRKKYCILNKQYTQEEYEKLAAKIIEHMQKTGEWGELFPITLSPFAYNESTAGQFHPLSRDQVLAHGWQWREPDAKEYAQQSSILPDVIDGVTDDIVKQVLACASCKRNYKIVAQELDFYRRKGLPVPNQCFFCRHHSRHESRNPRMLWSRTCDKCGKEILTSFSPERPEKVYCESCYVQAVF